MAKEVQGQQSRPARWALRELSAVERDGQRRLRAAVEAGDFDDAVGWAMLVAETHLQARKVREALAFLAEFDEPPDGQADGEPRNW